jgi:hypothetical protein
MAQDDGIAQIAGAQRQSTRGIARGETRLPPCSYHAIYPRRKMPEARGQSGTPNAMNRVWEPDGWVVPSLQVTRTRSVCTCSLILRYSESGWHRQRSRL